MKNKKGFMFVETIMVMTVLTTTLLTIYITFSRVLLNEKRRAMFDDTSYLYRTYLIEDYLASLNLSSYIKTYLIDPGNKITTLNPTVDLLYNLSYEGVASTKELGKQSFSDKTLGNNSEGNSLNVVNIYITYYNVNELKQCTSKTGRNLCKDKLSMETLNSMSTNAILYLRTLSGTGDGYRLIIEYKDTYIDFKKTQRPKDGTCSKNYILDNNTCYRQVTKSYFSSVKLHTEL